MNPRDLVEILRSLALKQEAGDLTHAIAIGDEARIAWHFEMARDRDVIDAPWGEDSADV